MKPRTLARRPLWLLALPILSFSSLSPSHAQEADAGDAATPTQPAGQPTAGQPTAGQPAGDDANGEDAPIDTGAEAANPVDVGGDTGGAAVQEVETKPIDTLSFVDYSKSLGGSSELEINVSSVSPAELASQLSKTLGLRVEASAQWEAYPDSKLSAKIAKTSLWSALSQLKARGVDAQWIAPVRTLQLLPLSDASQATAPSRNPLSQNLSGALLSINRVQRTRALAFPAATDAGEKSDRFEMELSLRPDPRWRTIDGTASWAGLSLIDAKGAVHPVLAEAAGGTLEGAQAAFDASKVDAGGPVTLRGELRFAVVARSQKWNLNDLSKPAQLEVQRDGVPVKYEYLGTSDANGATSLKFAASNAANAPGSVIALPSADPAIPASNLPIYHFAGVGASGGLRLLKADNSPVEYLETGAGLQSPERSEFEVQTIPDPALAQPTTAAKAEIDVPLEWREVRVPFEIKNIPLP